MIFISATTVFASLVAGGFIWLHLRIGELEAAFIYADQDVPTQAYDDLRFWRPERAAELMAAFWDQRAMEAEQTGDRDEAIILRLKARTCRDTPKRLLAVRVAHESPFGDTLITYRDENGIREARFSADDQKVMTVTFRGTVRLWEAATGQPLDAPLRQDERVYSASFSPDSSKVVTTGNDKTAQIWDAATGRPFGVPLGHEAAVLQASFSTDGRWIVTLTNSCVRWWERHDDDTCRLAGIRWARGIPWKGEPWLSPDGREVKAAETFDDNSVVLRTLHFPPDEADLPMLTGTPAELLADWLRRLALKFEDETRTPNLVPRYPAGSAK